MPIGLTRAGAEPKFTAVGDPGCFAYRRKAPGVEACLDFRFEPSDRIAPPMLALDRSSGVSARHGSRLLDEDRVTPWRPPVRLTWIDRSSGRRANLGRFDRAASWRTRGGSTSDRGVRAASPAGGPQRPGLLSDGDDLPGGRRSPSRPRTAFKKTVYLDPRHDEALLALALLAERRGDPKRPPASAAAPSGSRDQDERIEGERK